MYIYIYVFLNVYKYKYEYIKYVFIHICLYIKLCMHNKLSCSSHFFDNFDNFGETNSPLQSGPSFANFDNWFCPRPPAAPPSLQFIGPPPPSIQAAGGRVQNQLSKLAKKGPVLEGGVRLYA